MMAFLLYISTTIHAYDFKEGNLFYDIISETNQTAKVAGPESYSVENLIIPQQVIYNGKTYSVTSIGDEAFFGCSSLMSITLPSSVTSIGDNAFKECSALPFLTIPDSVSSIGIGAFDGCSSLSSITIPSTVTSIEAGTFNACSSLTSITIPSSVISIGDSAFKQCTALTSLTLPNSVTSIGNFAFFYCTELTTVTLPKSVTTIGEIAFSECTKLVSVTIPASVTSIGKYAFCHCPALTSVTILATETSIGQSAFSFSENIKYIYIHCEVPVKCEPEFAADVTMNAILHVPAGKLNEYKKIDPWRQFNNIVEMDSSGVEGIATAPDGKLRISVNQGIVRIEGIDNSILVTVCDMQGRVAFQGSSDSITNLEPGLYILKAGKHTVKFAI